MAGRVAEEVVLSVDERRFLEAQVRRHKAARSLSDRCRIIPLCSEGRQSKAVAGRLEVHEHTVGKWRRRFVKDLIEGLTDEYRPGRARTVSDEQVAEVIEPRLQSTPKDATHWSIRSIASETSLSHTTIRRIWTAFGLQPHRSETFKLSTDPLFGPSRGLLANRCRATDASITCRSMDKVQDVVGLYLSLPNRAIILCVDEKSQIQALDRAQPVLPHSADFFAIACRQGMAPGVAERRTHTHVRNLVVCRAGYRHRRRDREMRQAPPTARQCICNANVTRGGDRVPGFSQGTRPAHARRSNRHMPEGPDVYLVMDNHATHKTPRVKAWLARRPHWHVHFTPTSASWLNPPLGHVNMPCRAMGGTLVRRVDPQTATAGCTSLSGRTGKRYHYLHRRAQ